MSVVSNPTPMWKGVRKVLSTSGASVPFYILDDSGNTTLYKGTASPPPGSLINAVELFDIISPYVRQDDILAMMRYDYENDSISAYVSKVNQHFRLRYGNVAEDINVFADYSYSGSAGNFLNDDLDRRIPASSVFVITIKYCPVGSLVVKKNAGTTVQTFTVSDEAKPYNVVLSAGIFVPGDEVWLQLPDNTTSPKYTIVGDCGETWVLHYVNAFGGWDLLKMDGACRRIDTYDRTTADIAVPRLDNDGNLAAHRRVYRTTGGARFELNTGILTDEQATKFAMHVPGTTQAILQRNATFIPVQIVDSEVQRKTVATNGRVPASYTLTVQVLQDYVRI